MTEQPVKKGDWLVLEGEKYAKVIYCLPDLLHLRLAEKKNVVIVKPGTITFEIVNEKWKVMLLEEGRAKPEFKIGDTYIDCIDCPWLIDEWTMKFAKNDFEKGKVKAFFPIEKRIELN